MKIDLIVGARPNFMKIASLINAIDKSKDKSLQYRIIHTGQHFDKSMSQNFFDQLSIPLPDYNFKAGGGTQAEQTGKIMVKYEEILKRKPPKICIVVGDVTSTMACAIVAKKENVKVAHVEAGIRSFDLTMPEEINRMVTDSISDYFFTTSKIANKNLMKNGVKKESIVFVGNTMIDTLIKHRKSFFKPKIWDRLGLKAHNFIVLTMHRPSNVDDLKNINKIISILIKNCKNYKIVFPCHPRTKRQLQNLSESYPYMYLTGPLSYLEFNFLVENCKAVITDSGGITEEATYLRVPCLTLRENTERPETIEIGTNELVGSDPHKIKSALETLFSGNWKKGDVPELWDGKSGERIIRFLLTELK